MAEEWLLPVAAETWDGYLNDINADHVTRQQPQLRQLRGPAHHPQWMVASCAIPTACVFVIVIGHATVPDSSTHDTPVPGCCHLSQ